MNDTEITFESHPISYIQQLEQELIDLKPGISAYSDDEDLSYLRYEYQLWAEEQQEIIDDLISKLTKKQYALYIMFKYYLNEY